MIDHCRWEICPKSRQNWKQKPHLKTNVSKWIPLHLSTLSASGVALGTDHDFLQASVTPLSHQINYVEKNSKFYSELDDLSLASSSTARIYPRCAAIWHLQEKRSFFQCPHAQCILSKNQNKNVSRDVEKKNCRRVVRENGNDKPYPRLRPRGFSPSLNERSTSQRPLPSFPRLPLLSNRELVGQRLEVVGGSALFPYSAQGELQLPVNCKAIFEMSRGDRE